LRATFLEYFNDAKVGVQVLYKSHRLGWLAANPARSRRSALQAHVCHALLVIEQKWSLP
jgi:hypothetical protein